MNPNLLLFLFGLAGVAGLFTLLVVRRRSRK